jgi:hypothetical protein
MRRFEAIRNELCDLTRAAAATTGQVGEENLDETAHAAEATARAEHLQRTHA